MRKKFAPLAVLFGLLGALLLGGASVANANTGFDCDNVNSISVVKVKCVNVGVNVGNVLSDITINIKDIRFLNDNEIKILENNLNNAQVNIEVLENVTINTLNSFGGIHVSDVNVQTCAAVVGSVFKSCT